MYGKTTKCPHKTNMEQSINDSKPVASVGDCVYFSLLVSSTPGLIAQMSRFLMHHRYHYACVFVDNNYYFTYVHLLKTQTGDEVV